MDQSDTFISESSFFQGDISASRIIVEGRVVGNLTASSSIFIKEDGWVEGNIQAPNIYLAKDCYHKGGIYLEDSANATTSKINLQTLEFAEDHSEPKRKKEDHKEKSSQPVSSHNPNKLW